MAGLGGGGHWPKWSARGDGQTFVLVTNADSEEADGITGMTFMENRYAEFQVRD